MVQLAGRALGTALGVRPDLAERLGQPSTDHVFGAIPIQKQTDQGGVDTVPSETTTQRTNRSRGFVAPGAESSTYVPVATSATASRHFDGDVAAESPPQVPHRRRLDLQRGLRLRVYDCPQHQPRDPLCVVPAGLRSMCCWMRGRNPLVLERLTVTQS